MWLGLYFRSQVMLRENTATNCCLRVWAFNQADLIVSVSRWTVGVSTNIHTQFCKVVKINGWQFNGEQEHTMTHSVPAHDPLLGSDVQIRSRYMRLAMRLHYLEFMPFFSSPPPKRRAYCVCTYLCITASSSPRSLSLMAATVKALLQPFSPSQPHHNHPPEQTSGVSGGKCVRNLFYFKF